MALIPARGGSKGIPRKNLALVDGIPLVAHKIIQALASQCTEVWVSSEDSEIQSVSESFGAKIIHRPDELASDESGTDSVINHAALELKLTKGDILVVLQPTSPLIRIESINNCINSLVRSDKYNCVITIRESSVFNWITKGENVWTPDGHDRFNRKRRQELPISGWETGGCYALRINNSDEQISYHQSPTSVVKVGHIEALDVDQLSDLEEAVSVLRLLRNFNMNDEK